MTAYDFLLIFAREHWFLAWCALWLVWGVIWLVVVVLSLSQRLVLIAISRLYRTIMVAARGWPPAHLDADGDWRPAPKVVEKTETATIGDMSHTTTRARQL